jgi:hypothetical protein
VDKFREHGNVFGRDDRRLLLALGRGGQSGAEPEKSALDCFSPRLDLGALADAAGEAEEGVEFVDGAIGLDP